MTPPRGKILVVDDERDATLIFKTWLEAEGYEVTESGDGADALQQILDSEYDLVLMDYEMPYLNARQVCEALKNTGKGSTPLVMVTGHTDLDSNTLKQQGAMDVLYKPVNHQMLLYRVAKLINTPQQKP